MNDDKLTRVIIRNDIQRDRIGSQLTPAAVERAVDFAANQTGAGLNFGQLKEIGIAHVTDGVFKTK